MNHSSRIPSTLDFDELRPCSPFMGPHHDRWRIQVRSFVDTEIAPHIDAWQQIGQCPDELYLSAAAAGILGMGFPEHLGGCGNSADLYQRIIVAEEFHRLGTGVVFADLATHWISLPAVVDSADEEMRERVIRPVLRGEKKIAFAVTEPSGGSDVANLQTRAERDGDHFVVNGTKSMISGILRADFVLTAVRTGGAGMGGISLLLIDTKSPGVTRKAIPGMRWYNANNGILSLSNVRVPASHLIGSENRGFASLAGQFNVERLSGIAATLAMSRVCTAEAIAWARQRTTFGKRLIDHQSIRHKLVEMVRQLHSTYAYLDHCVWQFGQGQTPVADLAMLKVQATSTLESCARESLQVLGQQAYTGNNQVEHIYRESRMFVIGGGAEEVLRDLAAKQLGL